ncbi:hypothetical protein EDB85DRAFT_2139692 [Lactarius pseudohatsudake]|nr:hypothetical protein EDB85DRAFT_2139692 [Lactarius pseudohatsudake]
MSPSDLHGDPEAQVDVEDRQVVDTTDRQRGDISKTQTPAENYGDPSGRLWSMYLTEAKKEDGQITKNWTEDTNGVLVFTGLYSAIVAAFTMESYKKLSPDSGDQTVALLAQLVNASTGALVVVQSSPPFKAPASIPVLRAPRDVECSNGPEGIWNMRSTVARPEGGRVLRAYMFEGVEKFRLSQAVEAIPLLLHTSVFLFFVGLIDFLLPINKVVAFSALGCVVVFALIYAILTLLPSLHLNCPYRTPLSGITYISLQLSALNLFSIAIAIEGIFHELLLEIRRRSRPDARGSQDDWPARTHYERFWRGLRWRVEFSAMDASPSVDVNALHWTLTTLDEDKEFEDFASRIPGFFDPRAGAGSDATSTIISLMSERKSGQSISDPILGSRLRELLDTCLPGSSLLTEEQRKNRLRVCLKSLWYCVKAYNEKPEVPLASYVRAIFASPEVIRRIQTEQDLSTRLLGRCFGSLVVKKLANDITSRASFAAITAEMACLSYLLGTTSQQVKDWIDQDTIDLVNVLSLASGEMDALVAGGTKGVPTDVMDVFQQTLSILAEGIVPSSADVEWDLQVAQLHEICSKFANARIPDEIKERLRYILEKLSPYAGEVKIRVPSPEPDSGTSSSLGTSQKLRLRIGGVPESSLIDGNSSTPTPD